jgi:Thioesterase domain
MEDSISVESINAPGRGALNQARLDEHLQSTCKRLKQLGVRFGDSVASVLPEGPDAITARLAVTAFSHANYSILEASRSREQYESLLLEIDPKLLLMHPGEHPSRDAARSLGIPVANVLRHFEAGVFTLEAAVAPARATEVPPAWKNRTNAVPLVLIAPGLAYRRLAKRLDARHPVIGITPPSLEHLPPPHTIQHVAAECVRVLRRFRPQGPYALAGWRTEGLVALEMARLLEEEGERVAFVAMLDASELFHAPVSRFRRAMYAALRVFRKKHTPGCPFMAEALRQYCPRPWFGKILNIRPFGESHSLHLNPRFEWRDIAPQGVESHQAPGEILAEPGMQTVAAILAAELARVPKESTV